MNHHPNQSNLTPFKKGQSGNPSGRRTGSENLSTQLLKMLKKAAPDAIVDAKFAQEFVKGKKRITNADAVCARLLKAAIIDGNLKAIKELLDRAYGKPLARQEISGAGGAPVQMRTVLVLPGGDDDDGDDEDDEATDIGEEEEAHSPD